MSVVSEEKRTSLLTTDNWQLTTIPKISDFGLAKLLTGAHGVETRSGAILGTPSYMAPEQARGKAKEVGPAADIYALGAILYELLTGRPPFRAETALETLHQVQAVEPVPPSRLQPHLPRDLETITLKCLAKEPARRYLTARELAEDLQRWLEGRPIQARRVRMAERAWRWCWRNPKLASAVGAAALFLVLGTVVSALLAVHALAEARRADQEAVSARARHYASEMKLASLDWEAGRASLVQQRLREQQPHDAGAPDPRGFEWYYLQRLCQLELRTLKGHTDWVYGVAFSPDGRHLASASRDGTVRLWETATGQGICTLRGHTGPVWGVAFSPDGRRIASAGQDGAVRVWDAAACREIVTLTEHTGAVYGVAFSPDGKHLASAGADQTVKVWDLSTGQESFCLTGYRGPIRSVAFSPDGRHLASASADRTVMMWSVATGQKLRTLQERTGRVFAVAFSPDGRWLASANQYEAVRLWDAATGQEMRPPPLKGHTGGFWSVAFSPDGRRLAGANHDGTVRLWDAAIRQKTLTFERHAGQVNGVAFSPDGRYLASAGVDQTVKVWDAAIGQELRTLRGHTGVVIGVTFSRDGRLASASWDGTVRLWDAATGQEIRTLRGHTSWVLGVVFSPDGRRLASAGDDGTVRVWDAATGRETLTLQGSTNRPSVRVNQFRTAFRLSTPAFSPDGRCLAGASRDNAVKVWDAATGQELLTCSGHRGRVLAVAFRPDGKQLASASDDGTVKLWDTATGQEVLCLRAHTGWVTGVAFSPDGRRLASASTDRTVRVWDTATGQEMLNLKHTGPIFGITFSPDGRRLASAGMDGTVKVWDATDLTPQRLIEHEARGLVEWLFEESRLPALPVIIASTIGLMASPQGQGPLLAASALRPGRTPLPEEVAAAIRRDPTITAAVRQRALAWVEPYGRIQLRARAAR